MLSKHTTVATQLVPTADGAELHLERLHSIKKGRFAQLTAGVLLVAGFSLILPDAYGELALLLQLFSFMALLLLGGAGLVIYSQQPQLYSIELHQGKLRQQGLAGPREYALVDLVKLVQFEDRIALYGYDGSLSTLPLPPSDQARRFVALVRQQHAIALEGKALAEAGRDQAQEFLQRAAAERER